jgi:hypothetical protein
MDDRELLARVRALRAERFTPKAVAAALGVTSAEATRLVRQVARDDAARAPEGAVVGCWLSPGWREGLEAPADWPDTAVTDGTAGIVSVLVARRHRSGKVSVTGYLVDVYCLGVKDALGPQVIDDAGLRGMVRRFFSAYEAPPLTVAVEVARELVWGAVAYARGLGFEPHPDFEAASGHRGVGADVCRPVRPRGKALLRPRPQETTVCRSWLRCDDPRSETATSTSSWPV